MPERKSLCGVSAGAGGVLAAQFERIDDLADGEPEMVGIIEFEDESAVRTAIGSPGCSSARSGRMAGGRESPPGLRP